MISPLKAEDRILKKLEILIEKGDWSSVSGLEDLARGAVELAVANCGASSEEIAVLFTNEQKMQELNHQFRGKNEPTNVLSFPSSDGESLGDIALCWEAISREADEQGKKIEDHVAHLLVHGVLHLFGYDHEEDGQAEKMETVEIRILDEMGIKNPYEE